MTVATSSRMAILILAAWFMLGAAVAQPPPPGSGVPRFPPDIVPPEVLGLRDALRVDAAHYQLEFENERMRVLRLTLKADESSRLHDSRDALVICVKECHVRLISPTGRVEDVHIEAGKSRWIFGESRSEKNLSTQPAEILFVEPKAGPGSK